MSQHTNLFVNKANRAVVLRRENDYCNDVSIRVTNHSTIELTPYILVGDNGSVTIRTIISGTALVPRASQVFRIEAEDVSGNLFNEKFLYLDYEEGTSSDPDVGKLGLEFEIIQDDNDSVFNWYSDESTATSS